MGQRREQRAQALGQLLNSVMTFTVFGLTILLVLTELGVDITPLLASPRAFHIVLDSMAERFIGEHVDAVVGVEARGFIFGGALAARLNASFVPVRKPGKLPYRTDKVSYSLEYGESELEMHRDSLSEGARVLVVDDLLATGGTAAAAGELVHRQGAYVAAYAFVVELRSLGGRDRLVPTPVIAFLQYD